MSKSWISISGSSVSSAAGQSSRSAASNPRRTTSTFSFDMAAEYPAPHLSSVRVATEAPDRITEQRRALPNGPGVYIFRDARRKVLYVGKARSIRKRVASHFSKPGGRGATDMVAQIADIDFIATETEAEALLAEQEFIKRHRSVFNVLLRDDKSYPFIGISMDEGFPCIYFTREK